MNIDWSKAPAWAVGHALHAFGGEIREVWVGEHQYQRLDQPKPFPYGGGNSDHRHNPRRYWEIASVITAPAKKRLTPSVTKK